MSTINKYKSSKFHRLLFCLMVFLFISVSCVDDDLIMNDPEDPDKTEFLGDAVGFYVELDRSLTTRDISLSIRSGVEAKDDWIDMQDKFRVFFFTEDGDFLFGANDRIVGSVENFTGSSSKDYWYVRIPMTMIVDRKDQEYDIDKIKSYLKNNKFKIAVLANWPNAGDKINPSDFDDSADNNFKENPSSTLKGEPLWGWENSILNLEAKKEDLRNINDLHHIYNDTYYGDYDSSITTGRPQRLQVYGNFMAEYTDNNGKTYYGMGQPTDWVKMRDIAEGWAPKCQENGMSYDNSGQEITIQIPGPVPSNKFDTKESANAWIRAYWNPSIEINENKKIYRHYQHLWFLWNFNAIYTVGKSTNQRAAIFNAYAGNFQWDDGINYNSSSTINKWGHEWWDRNGELLYENWIKGNENSLGDYSLPIGSANNTAYLEFKAPIKNKAKLVSKSINDVTRYGIQLPVLEEAGSGNSGKIVDRNDEEKSKGFFKFSARTSGTLRIKWGSADNNAASIVVQKGGTQDKKFTVNAGNQNKWFDINGTMTNTDPYRDISIGGDSEDIYIWCAEGNAVIYGIEYIRGKYLYDTDREGVYPNENQGIPMFGVQEFDPIPEWEYGSTYTLSTNVSLIRALAKVILYIPDFNGKRPRHVYMRSMNRTAHCEPMDVQTNTSDLWFETDHDVTSNSAKKANCEWFNIQKYGPGLTEDYTDAKEVKDDSELKKYKDWLSWFYGSWRSTTWKFEGDKQNDKGFWVRSKEIDEKGWNFQNVEDQTVLTVPDGEDKGLLDIDKRNDKYPHLFNPHINRSDFCSFIYVGKVHTTDGMGSGENSTSGLNKYVLYVPDKHIDDPNYPGIFSCTPKVPHIEFRYEPDTSKKLGEEDVTTEYSNDEFNLDDASCFRIYFTNYGYTTGTGNDGFFQTETNQKIRDVYGESYDTYEKNADNLKYHWPIMRNHIYEFYVSTSGPETPQIAVKVTDWAHKKVVVDW